MSIKPNALKWLSINHNGMVGDIRASKYYKSEEAWAKKTVWFFEIPIKKIKSDSGMNINLLCQILPDKDGFYLLQVPKSFFLANVEGLYIRKEMVSIYLSAEKNRKFSEQRGSGNLDFSKFLV